MAETSYERGYRQGQEGAQIGRQSERTGGTFLTQRYGPLPVWAWAAVALLIAIGFYLWRKKQNANANASTTTTPDSNIPQFVNQTYTNVYPPIDVDQGPKNPKPPTDKDTRTWTASATASTVAEIVKRLKVFGGEKNLKPANAIAQKFMEQTYPKNHNAKIPKGAKFTYQFEA